MDTLLSTALTRRNVAVLSMQGLERSRFFLRFSLNLLARKPHAKIYHVLDNDRLVQRVKKEADLMPFEEFGPIKLNLTICTTTSLHQQTPQPRDTKDQDATNVVIFDVVSLESLEGTIVELHKCEKDMTVGFFYQINYECYVTSIVLACNGPLDGSEAELGIKFDNIITYDCIQAQQKGSASYGDESLWPSKEDYRPIMLDDTDANNRAKLHDSVGSMLERIANSPSSGRVVVFFPTYGKMVEFHSAWKQLGVFDRIGIPYARENRGGDHFKNALKDLASRDRSIFLCSIRYHQNEDLAEMVLGQVETFVIVGLPYPIMSDAWKYRLAIRPRSTQLDILPVMLGRSDLCKCRAIDFMNGIIKRCLFNGYRSKPCHFLILGERQMQDIYRHKLVNELGDVQVWPQSRRI